MATITEVIDQERGCGWRKPGGIYLRSDEGIWRDCARLPIPCSVCPACGGGIKPARGFTWFEPDPFIEALPACPNKGSEVTDSCRRCLLNGQKAFGRAGLIWIGVRHYADPERFVTEALSLGISRRLPTIPHRFTIGETWIFLAHREAITEISLSGATAKPTKKPGIFGLFKPTRIEYVVRGDETDEELDRLEKRGLTLVRVLRDEQADLIDS